MKPDELLDAIRADEVSISLDGGDLKIAGAEAKVMRWLPVLKRSKPELIDLLRKKSTGRIWTPGNPFLCSCGYRTGWRLNERPLCPVCHADLIHPGNQPIIDSFPEIRQQIICQAFAYNGVMMATTKESCREWQGEYCRGCTLSTIQ